MLVLPVFLTRLSSIKVRRENDCKGKTQILKIKKKKQYYQTLTIITKAFIRFQYILTCWHGSLIRNPLEVTSAFTLFVASLFSSLLFFSTCSASSNCIFRSNAASSAFRLFSSSSLWTYLCNRLRYTYHGNCFGMQQTVRRDVISLILWQYMADYGNSKSYCHTNISL